MKRLRQRARTGWLACTIAVCLAGSSLPARAVLGAGASSIDIDQRRVGGAHRSAAVQRTSMQAHEITMADGSSIREFVTPGGVVFAVAWSTRFKPDLDALLGAYAPLYAAGAAEALRVPGVHRHIELRRGDLVVHSTVHLNAYVGRAWLASFVPPGVGLDALR